MRAFRGMADVEINIKNSRKTPNFLTDEEYKVKVEVCKYVEAESGKDFFVIEAEILESTTDKLKPGTVASQVINVPGHHKLGLADVKMFIAAANGLDPTDADAVADAFGKDKDGNDQGVEAVIFATSDDNPLQGVELMLKTERYVSKNDREFTKHYWSPLA